MTERERFLATIERGAADRAPLWDEGVQEEVLEVWRQQGMPRDETPETRFRFDRREMVEVNLEAAPDGPLNADGSGPSARLARLRAGYRPDGRRRLPADWERHVAAWAVRDYPLGIAISRGLFRSLEIGDWSTLAPALYALYDEPAEVQATMERATELSLALLDRVLPEVTLDFAIFNEPIAGFHAPVVSPAHYRRFALPHLRRLVERLRAAGVAGLIVQTYGQVECLIPLWVEAGINTLWCSHAASVGIDYRALRRRYGEALRLIGGIPVAALHEGQARVRAALAGVAAPLLAEGGYLPMLDDRVRVTVPYDSYLYYRDRLEQEVAGR